MKKGANILMFNMIRHESRAIILYHTNQTEKVTWEPSGSIARQQATRIAAASVIMAEGDAAGGD